MAYDETLGARLRKKLSDLPGIEEKEMFGGLVFMYKDKMLCGVIKDELMCRIDPDIREELLEQNGVTEMKMKQTVMRGFVLVAQSALQTNKELKYWIDLCLKYNLKAKASKKRQGSENEFFRKSIT